MCVQGHASKARRGPSEKLLGSVGARRGRRMRRNFSPPPADKKFTAVAIYPAFDFPPDPALDPAPDAAHGIPAACFVDDEDVVRDAPARLNGDCALGRTPVPNAPAGRVLDARAPGTGVMVLRQRLAERSLPDLLPAERQRRAARPVVALPGPAGG